jgi:hypothetical protein
MQIGCGILSIIGVILDVIVINSYEYKLFHNTIQTYLTIVVVICSIGSAWVSFEMSMILNRLGKNDLTKFGLKIILIYLRLIFVKVQQSETIFFFFKNDYFYMFYDVYIPINDRFFLTCSISCSFQNLPMQMTFHYKIINIPCFSDRT